MDDDEKKHVISLYETMKGNILKLQDEMNSIRNYIIEHPEVFLNENLEISEKLLVMEFQIYKTEMDASRAMEVINKLEQRFIEESS